MNAPRHVSTAPPQASDAQAVDSSAADTAAADTVRQSVVDTLSTDVPSAAAQGLDAIMTADGKIWVVVAVVLIIWFGLLLLLFRTDRRLDRLERQVEKEISNDDVTG